MDTWAPSNQKQEDVLLKEYLDQVGGLAYMEVLVGDMPSRSRRRLDAVRIPARAGEGSERLRYRDGERQKFLDRCREAPYVEVIEVKNQLAPWVVGQVHIGRLLLTKDIRSATTKVRPVVVMGNQTQEPAQVR